MAGITGSDLNVVKRRMASVAGHLIPDQTRPGNGIELSNCSSGLNDSYHRVHGEVPTHAPQWKKCNDSEKEFTDIIYEKAVGEGIAKITINRPERRNSFRPQTVKELMRAFNDARDDNSIGVIIFTGKVAGYAVGGGHELHMLCDITIAADNAVFGQTGPKVGSFDAGYGASIMDRLIGPKTAREMWFMARFYKASEAEKMGLINIVVPLEKLEEETVKWCREIMRNSPMAIRVLKSALNAVDDGHSGLQQIAGDITLMFYDTEEGSEGKNSYLERRKPDFSRFPRLP